MSYNPPPPYPPFYPQPVKKYNKPLIIVAGITVGLLALCVVGEVSTLANKTTPAPLQTIVTPTTYGPPPTKSATRSEAAVKVYTAGDWVVGKEIAPGLYNGTTDGVGCYWARIRNFNNDLNSIITNGNIAPGQRIKVNVLKGDKGLSLSGDCNFQKAP
jgi:hypothetical protein